MSESGCLRFGLGPARRAYYDEAMQALREAAREEHPAPHFT